MSHSWVLVSHSWVPASSSRVFVSHSWVLVNCSGKPMNSVEALGCGNGMVDFSGVNVRKWPRHGWIFLPGAGG